MSPIERDSLPESWSRVAIVSVSPQVDGGRWPVRRSVGERVDVVAGIIIDGHDKIAAEVRVGHEDDAEPSTVPLKLRYNDEYVGHFDVTTLGSYHYQVSARSEEHTSELQSRGHLVCRLLLEKHK